MTFSAIKIEIDLHLQEITVNNHSDKYTCLATSLIMNSIILLLGDNCYNEVTDAQTFLRVKKSEDFAIVLSVLANLGDNLPDKIQIDIKE